VANLDSVTESINEDNVTSRRVSNCILPSIEEAKSEDLLSPNSPKMRLGFKSSRLQKANKFKCLIANDD
jgi:hypothetical protein